MTLQSILMLDKVNPDHGAQVIWPPAIIGLGINRLNQSLNLRPRNHPIHLGQKDLTPDLLAPDPVFHIRKTYLANITQPREKNMNTRHSQSKIVAS
jgi:hypothetical protein